MKINEKNITTQHQKKDLKDLLTFAYLSINYKATEQTNIFIFLLLILLQRKFIKTSIDYKYWNICRLQMRNHKHQRQEKQQEKKQRITRPRHWKIYIFAFSLISIDIDWLQETETRERERNNYLLIFTEIETENIRKFNERNNKYIFLCFS